MTMFEPGQSYQQFLNDYYTMGNRNYVKYVGLRAKGISAENVWSVMGYDPDAELEKAAADALLSTQADYYANAYASEVALSYTIDTELYKLLPKKGLLEAQDSFKILSSHGLSIVQAAPDTADALFSGITEPVPVVVDKIVSPYNGVEMARSLTNMLHEQLPKTREGTDWDWIKNTVAPGAFADNVDASLGTNMDTPALKNIESIDRMITSTVECTGVNWASAATDGDIFWDGEGVGAAKVDADTDAWANSPVTLGGTATADDSTVFAILEEIDDLMAEAKRKSKRKNYIALTTPSTYSKICDEIEPGLRMLPDTVKVSQNIGGISTYGGQDAGFDVGAIVSNGISMPLFVSSALSTTSTIKTTATSGHVYMLDMEHIYVRVDMPMTYLETGFGVDMLHQNALTNKAILFTLQNLVADQFTSHAALKWITA